MNRELQMLDRLLNASLQSLSKDDIELIANGGVQEDSVIEFKEGLDETAERDQRAWAEGGKLSRTSKADLIKELIAFSNAYGGTLYFGVKESNDVQRRSAGILPISGCDPKWCNQAVRRSDLFGLLSLAAAARCRARAFQ